MKLFLSNQSRRPQKQRSKNENLKNTPLSCIFTVKVYKKHGKQ